MGAVLLREWGFWPQVSIKGIDILLWRERLLERVPDGLWHSQIQNERFGEVDFVIRNVAKVRQDLMGLLECIFLFPFIIHIILNWSQPPDK